MGKAVMKKPAKVERSKAEATKNTKGTKGPPCMLPGVVYDKFDLPQFGQEVCDVLGVRVASDRILRLLTGCSGSGAPTLVCESILGKRRVLEEAAVECNRAAAFACQLNVDPRHIFTDLAMLTKPERINKGKLVSCFTHGGGCRPPPTTGERPHLAILGIECKDNTTQRPDRFKTDATVEAHAHIVKHAADFLLVYQPTIWILENVQGMLRPRGGDGPDAKKPVIDWILEMLEPLRGKGYTIFVRDLRVFQLALRKASGPHLWVQCAVHGNKHPAQPCKGQSALQSSSTDASHHNVCGKFCFAKCATSSRHSATTNAGGGGRVCQCIERGHGARQASPS